MFFCPSQGVLGRLPEPLFSPTLYLLSVGPTDKETLSSTGEHIHSKLPKAALSHKLNPKLKNSTYEDTYCIRAGIATSPWELLEQQLQTGRSLCHKSR